MFQQYPCEFLADAEALQLRQSRGVEIHQHSYLLDVHGRISWQGWHLPLQSMLWIKAPFLHPVHSELPIHVIAGFEYEWFRVQFHFERGLGVSSCGFVAYRQGVFDQLVVIAVVQARHQLDGESPSDHPSTASFHVPCIGCSLCPLPTPHGCTGCFSKSEETLGLPLKGVLVWGRWNGRGQGRGPREKGCQGGFDRPCLHSCWTKDDDKSSHVFELRSKRPACRFIEVPAKIGFSATGFCLPNTLEEANTA